MTQAEAKKVFVEIMTGFKRGWHLSPQGKAIFAQAKAVLRGSRKSVMRNTGKHGCIACGRGFKTKAALEKHKKIHYAAPGIGRNPLSRSKAREMLHRHEYSSKAQQRFLGARASGYRPLRNPRGLKDINGGAVYDITYQKRGSHRCDAKCRAVRHMYRHSFSSKPRISGNPDGSLTIHS
jgi:hypothetical protein